MTAISFLPSSLSTTRWSYQFPLSEILLRSADGFATTLHERQRVLPTADCRLQVIL